MWSSLRSIICVNSLGIKEKVTKASDTINITHLDKLLLVFNLLKPAENERRNFRVCKGGFTYQTEVNDNHPFTFKYYMNSGVLHFNLSYVKLNSHVAPQWALVQYPNISLHLFPYFLLFSIQNPSKCHWGLTFKCK